MKNDTKMNNSTNTPKSETLQTLQANAAADCRSIVTLDHLKRQAKFKLLYFSEQCATTSDAQTKARYEALGRTWATEWQRLDALDAKARLIEEARYRVKLSQTRLLFQERKMRRELPEAPTLSHYGFRRLRASQRQRQRLFWNEISFSL